MDNSWIKKNSAIIIIHGIGNQNPIETLDAYCRELFKVLQIDSNPNVYKVSHHIAKKESSSRKDPWFDNFLRLEKKDSLFYLDVYEYYWANYTEDQATLEDLSKWLGNVTSGAKKFYTSNANFISSDEKNINPFISSNGKFDPVKFYITYWLPLTLIGNLITFSGALSKFILKGIKVLIPIAGAFISRTLQSWLQKNMLQGLNVMNDITIYNTYDEKSKFHCIRKQILDGAVDSIRFLLESNTGELKYEQVIVSGHSLGTQIGYDAINKLNHLICAGEIKGYNVDGYCTHNPQIHVSNILNSFITFGSPLDKIAFFFREQTKDEEYVRREILNNYHCFRQGNWNNSLPNPISIVSPNHRLFEKIEWLNYYDKRDYISGKLDYYVNVKNVNCFFEGKYGFLSFTHSYYWKSPIVYHDTLKLLSIDTNYTPPKITYSAYKKILEFGKTLLPGKASSNKEKVS